MNVKAYLIYEKLFVSVQYEAIIKDMVLSNTTKILNAYFLANTMIKYCPLV